MLMRFLIGLLGVLLLVTIDLRWYELLALLALIVVIYIFGLVDGAQLPMVDADDETN